MGHISGICNFDGGPVRPEDLAGLHGTPGSEDHLFISGGLAMTEQGGSAAIRHGLACHWEGRLDNRYELARALKFRPESTEAELVLSVAAKKRPEDFADIIGDWSVAIWNGVDRSVCLASDYAGIRPLYFVWSPRKLVWSSSLEALSKWTGQSELDHDYIAEFLIRGAASEGRTPWRRIRAVPGGCILHIRETGIREQKFWNPPLESETVFVNEADYEEQFRLLFRQAVRSRLDLPGIAIAELSGGLDSSAVVCMAKDLIQSGEVTAAGLITLSYDNEFSSDAGFIRKIEGSCGFPAHHYRLDETSFASASSVGGSFPVWWDTRNRTIGHWASGMGASTILTGQLGDLVAGNWFEGNEHVADDLSHRRFGAALRNTIGWGRTQRQPVYHILSRAIQLTVSRRMKSSRDANLKDATLAPAIARRASELTKARIVNTRPKTSPGRCERMGAFIDMLHVRHLQSPENLRPITWSHAFTHRPLVEFMMTIPTGIVYRPGEPRRLMRRALAGIVPDAGLSRRSKAGYNDAFRRSLVPMANGLLQSGSPLVLAEHGFVDSRATVRRLRHFTQGIACNEVQLRQVLLLEYWLRSQRKSSGPSVLPTDSLMVPAGSS
jgi:asparagine synthase (glutamine-hydrolysing)